MDGAQALGALMVRASTHPMIRRAAGLRDLGRPLRHGRDAALRRGDGRSALCRDPAQGQGPQPRRRQSPKALHLSPRRQRRAGNRLASAQARLGARGFWRHGKALTALRRGQPAPPSLSTLTTRDRGRAGRDPERPWPGPSNPNPRDNSPTRRRPRPRLSHSQTPAQSLPPG